MSRLTVTAGSLQAATEAARDEAERKELQRKAEEVKRHSTCIAYHLQQINSVLVKVANLSSKGEVVGRPVERVGEREAEVGGYYIDEVREHGHLSYMAREGEYLELAEVRGEVIRVLHEQGLSAVWVDNSSHFNEVKGILISWGEADTNQSEEETNNANP
jgi:hypothetical protein